MGRHSALFYEFPILTRTQAPFTPRSPLPIPAEAPARKIDGETFALGALFALRLTWLPWSLRLSILNLNPRPRAAGPNSPGARGRHFRRTKRSLNFSQASRKHLAT